MNKHYLSADTLLAESFELAIAIYESGYRPDFIVGVWRGGTPIGIAIQEMLDYLGVHTDHIAIRTSSYTGIGERSKEVRVHGLGYITERIKASDSLLIVDDVYDTGLSVQEIIKQMRLRCGDNCPDMKVATPYFKPNNNRTSQQPDFYLHETDDWLVFPHEMMGLPLDDLLQNKPSLNSVAERLRQLSKP